MARSSSKRVQTSAACAPLRDLWADLVVERPTAWDQVADRFLRAMEAFDANVVSGLANQGDRQNGKGDFLNDVLGLLLEGCAGVELHNRGKVPGLIFPRHNLDITWPERGLPRLLIEVKAVGTPQHPGNPAQKPIGRPGASDLPKRVKEAAFKTLDLKAEYNRRRNSAGGGGRRGPGGNLTTWAREMEPKCYLFIAARTVGESDKRSIAALARSAAQVMDGVGVFCFRALSEDKPTTYAPDDVDRDIELAAVLERVCTDLIGLTEHEAQLQPAPPSPGEQAELALAEARIDVDDDSDEQPDA